MGYETILIERPLDGVLRITINRPERLNSISIKTELELDAALVEADGDKSVRCVILTGAGDKAFSTGYDMGGDGFEKAPDYKQEGLGPYLEYWHNREELHMNSLLRVWDLSKPVIAAVNGYAIAGGCEYAMMCDITIASENAVFGEPELRHVSSPPTLIMPYVIGWKAAKRLLLTGDSITAQEALRLGMINSVVPQAELQEQALLLAERIARIPRLSVKFNKLAINRTVEAMGLREGLANNLELTTLAHTVKTREDSEALEAARKEGGLKGFLKARDGWFNEQGKKLKV